MDTNEFTPEVPETEKTDHEKPAPDDGGPAFPHDYIQANLARNGMSLRDWFAGMALQGMLSDHSIGAEVKIDTDIVARSSYEFADAMIRARKARS